jgi:hypothetical protein
MSGIVSIPQFKNRFLMQPMVTTRAYNAPRSYIGYSDAADSLELRYEKV